MRRLAMLAEQFKQDAHSKDLMKRLTAIVLWRSGRPEEKVASATHVAMAGS